MARPVHLRGAEVPGKSLTYTDNNQEVVIYQAPRTLEARPRPRCRCQPRNIDTGNGKLNNYNRKANNRYRRYREGPPDPSGGDAGLTIGVISITPAADRYQFGNYLLSARNV